MYYLNIGVVDKVGNEIVIILLFIIVDIIVLII